MAKFDIIDATGRAYQASWAERRYLLRLAAIPFLIQLACLTVATAVVKDLQYLRFSLIMVPAYLAEGWMLCHYVRLLCTGERWPFRSTGDVQKDMQIIAPRARGVLGGTIIYALIHLAIGLFTAGTAYYLMPYMPAGPDAAPPAVPAGIAFISFVMLALMIWGIRVVWLYIPYALNGSAVSYLLAVKGAGTSFYMAALWLLCLMPFVALLQFGITLIADPLGGVLGAQIGGFITLILSVIMDMAKSIVVTAGMTFALREIYNKYREIV